MPVLSEDSGLHETLALLTSQLRPDSNHKEEMGFLRDVFSERSLSYLMKAMLVVHDTVAQKNFDPVLPPLPDNFDDDFDEESVKIVRLVKNKEPLAQSQGSITLKIIPAIKEEDRLKDSKVFMRALFCYNPKEDRAIPCQEAGLPFKRRHVLEVVSQDDPTWWQAKRVGDTNLRAGLIPSKQFQERRLTYRRTIGTLQNAKTLKKPLFICLSFNVIPTLPFMLTTDDQSSDKAGLRRSFRLSRKEKENNLNEGKQAEQADGAEFLTYEEVTKYQQQPGEQQRLVVLIGCLGAKLSELKQKVVSENPQEYGVAVPHTTRSKKSHEKEGVEYNFVSKQSFETDVQQNKFVEHGEYKENLYGTSLEAIRSVMAKKKVCLVDVVPEAVKHLRTPEFKPYVIFVKPLITEKKKHALKSPISEEISSPLQDEEQQEIINSAAFIEEQYGHLIDTVLVKEDLQSACNQLKTVLEKLNKDSFWVPVSWVRS
ncbi:MAGUK p55 subfamily member 3 [Pitangus sulphuratus]|nr:MAGUK p55 subfamily member 3 [Pitangus sulphuratus]